MLLLQAACGRFVHGKAQHSDRPQCTGVYLLDKPIASNVIVNNYDSVNWVFLNDACRCLSVYHATVYSIMRNQLNLLTSDGDYLLRP